MRAALVERGAGYRWLDPSQAPSEAERRAMVVRLDAITASLGHRDRAGVRASLAGMMGVMKAQGATEAAAEGMVDLYAATLSDLPAWAVMRACADCARNRGPSDTFVPAAPQIRGMVEAALAPVLTERAKLRAVLSAEAPAASGSRPSADRVQEILAQAGMARGAAAGPARPTEAQRAAAQADLGLTDEQFASLPDQPAGFWERAGKALGDR